VVCCAWLLQGVGSNGPFAASLDPVRDVMSTKTVTQCELLAASRSVYVAEGNDHSPWRRRRIKASTCGTAGANRQA